ncbi:hypothetical protein ACFVT5_37785 [Streptomyces sp. NPDC058001]|uniref:hypothetical protein n=1 Tax=Streptomyces sp. NPDC058001 TaxID=3346300 RepID=UPI0036E9ADDE
MLRGQHTGRADDLDEAVQVLTEALTASRNAEQNAAIRGALGNAQRARFTLPGGDPAELETAITNLSPHGRHAGCSRTVSGPGSQDQ